MTPHDANRQDNTEQDYHRERVEKMIATAKTKAELQDLVRSLDARNIQLQNIRDRLQLELAQYRKESP
ncbi:hypothetical protein [Kocuria marina]|uniref:hypothetical protein n=1 Tax=Kocuria marina TaxID=223184 RepID=UPI0034607484